jgi:hypothetical protein
VGMASVVHGRAANGPLKSDSGDTTLNMEIKREDHTSSSFLQQ